jgi:hypothetical protein
LSRALAESKFGLHAMHLAKNAYLHLIA